MKILNVLINYLKLCRQDVAIGTFIMYLTGVLLAKNSLNPFDFLGAFLVSYVSFNFIYSYNQYADYKIDKINKPERPIPSGKISPKNALIYSTFLGIFSVIYPFLISDNLLTFSILLYFPLFGFLYSFRKIYLKKIPFFASILTSTGIFLSIYSGYTQNMDFFNFKREFVMIWIMLTIVILFKDFEDFEGDTANNVNNIHKYISYNRLSTVFFAGLTVNFGILYYFTFPVITFYIFAVANLLLGIIIVIGLFKDSFKHKTYFYLTKFLVIGILSYFLFLFTKSF